MTRHIVILGAGISGLALGWFLKRNFGSKIKLSILEKTSRVGGWIQSVEKGNFLFDLGPRSCRSCGNGAATLRLIEELNLQDQVIKGDPLANKRYLYTQQQLRQLPSNFFSMLFSPLGRGILPALYRDWRTTSGNFEDESIYDFMVRRFSKELAEQFMDPLVSGIYAGDIHQLSLRSCFPQLHEWEQYYGSVVRGAISDRKKTMLFSFQKGMETLPLCLEKRLLAEIQLNSEAVGLDFIENGVKVMLADGGLLHADHLYSTISAEALAPLIKPHHTELSQTLAGISSTSVAVVNMGYKKRVLQKSGFGYLVPSREKENILGVVWDSCVFPQQNRQEEETRLTVMLGGAHMSHFHQRTKDEFLQIALKALDHHLQIDLEPEMALVNIAASAIPQYTVGHEKRVSSIKKEMLHLSSNATLLGSSYCGVSVNDCIAQAETAATFTHKFFDK